MLTNGQVLLTAATAISFIVTGCHGRIIYTKANMSFSSVTADLMPAHRCAISLAPKFTNTGFRTLSIPTDLKRRLNAFWEKNHDKIEEEYVHPDYVWRNDNDSSRDIMGYLDLKRYDHQLAADMAEMVGGHLQEWTGVPVKHRVTYGLREYRRGAVLKPHVDRYATHVLSGIINVRQTGMDAGWPLVVWDHRRRMSEVYLNGTDDLALYESASVVHGRPFPLVGDSFVNMFIHFVPADNRWEHTCRTIRRCVPTDSEKKWWIV